MKICIGIVAHNRKDLLPIAIESALAQSFADKEVFVFDSGSTDGTPALRLQYPQIRWKRTVENVGYLIARNEMMQSTDADLYCSLDDDAWFMRGDELTAASELFSTQQDLAALAFDILSPDRPESPARTPPLRSHMFIGCGHVLRLSAVRSVGYYVESPGFYGGEEKDLCLRLLDSNFEILQTPGVCVWHEKTAIARDLYAQHRSGVCNDLAFAFRRFPMPMILWALPVRFLSHLRFAATHGKMQPCIEGMNQFLRNCAKISVTRRPVKSGAVWEYIRRASASS